MDPKRKGKKEKDIIHMIGHLSTVYPLTFFLEEYSEREVRIQRIKPTTSFSSPEK